MSKPWAVSRRKAVKLGAAAAALPLVHIRTAGAAGKLNIGFWDHWVPGANDVMQKQVNAWADKNKVEVNADFITSSGGKLALTPAAETQAKAGHDVMTFFTWDVHNYEDHLTPVDDVMQRLIAAHGEVNEVCSYLANIKGHWSAVPTSSGTQTKPPCARISWFNKHGLDIQAMYPAKDEKNALQDNWTWETFLKYAELAAKDNMTFAMGMGSGTLNTDATDVHGAIFAAFGGCADRCRGQVTTQIRRHAPSAGIRPAVGEILSVRCGQLRRCVEQPRVDLGQDSLDLQSAVRLGRRQARQPGCRRRLLDISRAGRPQRPLLANVKLLLGRV